MLINKNSFKINNTSYSSYLTEIKYGRHKIWGQDTGRNNIAGTYTGTLIGIFPKFTLSFGPLTKTQLETITPILDSAEQTITYYCPKTQTTKTISTYSGDYEYVNKNTLDNVNANEPFEISLIAKTKE